MVHYHETAGVAGHHFQVRVLGRNSIHLDVTKKIMKPKFENETFLYVLILMYTIEFEL